MANRQRACACGQRRITGETGLRALSYRSYLQLKFPPLQGFCIRPLAIVGSYEGRWSSDSLLPATFSQLSNVLTCPVLSSTILRPSGDLQNLEA